MVDRPWGEGTHLWKWEHEDAVLQKEVVHVTLYEIENKLSKVLPDIHGAVANLEKLESALRELRAIKNPPMRAKRVMAAICVFFKDRPDKIPDPNDCRKKLDCYWKPSKNRLSDPKAFVRRLRDYDKDHIDKSVMRKLAPFIEDPELDLEGFSKKGPTDVLYQLMSWAKFTFAYYFVAQELVPLYHARDTALAALSKIKKQVALGINEKQVEVFGKVVEVVQGGVQVEYDRPDMPNEVLLWPSLMDTSKVRINKPGAITRVELTSAAHVTLYDLNKHCVLPATAPRQCCLVELMAKGKQKSDYFASHWWGQSVQSFVSCLKQHSHDRGLESPQAYHNGTWYGEEQGAHPLYLEGRSGRYWVSAFALRQHGGVELGDNLKDAPFFQAILASKGTVVVVDSDGLIWDRTWCLLEMFYSLSCTNVQSYTFDMYTANPDKHTVVGITQGLAAVDRDATFKANREMKFPFTLLDLGLSFKFKKGLTSHASDNVKIKKAIGNQSSQLDTFVHGVVAASALCRVVGHRGLERSQQYLLAIKQGKVSTMRFDLRGRTSVDVEQTWVNCLEVLNEESCRHLEMGTHELTAFPEMVSNLRGLECLSMYGCKELVRLPKSIGNLSELSQLRVHGPNKLIALPKSVSRLSLLTYLDLTHCEELTHLPNLGSMKSLKRIYLKGCISLESLPDSLCSLQVLTRMNLDCCEKLQTLPDDIGRCHDLVKLSMRGCSSLVSLPDSIGKLKELEELTLQDCVNLKVLPKSLFKLGPNVVRTSGCLGELKARCNA